MILNKNEIVQNVYLEDANRKSSKERSGAIWTSISPELIRLNLSGK